MEREQTLLMVIDDLVNKLANAEHRASDYLAQATVAKHRLQELEYIQDVINSNPDLLALFNQNVEKLQEEADDLGNV